MAGDRILKVGISGSYGGLNLQVRARINNDLALSLLSRLTNPDGTRDDTSSAR